MLHKSQQSRAFTLVEILVVVVILGIASAVILPQLGNRDDLRAAAAARMVMADLIYAQNLAISNQSPRYIIFTGTGYSIHESVSGDAITHPIEKTPFVVTFGSGKLKEMSITPPDFGGSSIMGFDELGSPFSYNASASPPASALTTRGEIVVFSGNYALEIHLEPFTGETSVQR